MRFSPGCSCCAPPTPPPKCCGNLHPSTLYCAFTDLGTGSGTCALPTVTLNEEPFTYWRFGKALCGTNLAIYAQIECYSSNANGFSAVVHIYRVNGNNVNNVAADCWRSSGWALEEFQCDPFYLRGVVSMQPFWGFGGEAACQGCCFGTTTAAVNLSVEVTE